MFIPSLRTAGTCLVLALLIGPSSAAQRSAASRDSAARRAAANRDSSARRPPASRDSAAHESIAGVHAGGLLQVWYAQGDGGFLSTFRVRRAEIKLSGDVSPRARWAITLDAARALGTASTTTDVNGLSVVTGTTVNQGSRILVDALIALELPGRHQLEVGQFKVPIGYEGGVQSPATLETVERALFTSDRARGGIYGDSRDVGVMLRAPSGRDVDYSLGVFNGVGESQNDTDRNAAKAIAARAAARIPFLRQLSLGASGALSTMSSPDSVNRQRAGAEARFVAGPLMLKSEYMTGRDGLRRGAGWYGHVGYWLTRQLNLVARHDEFDPDVDRESTAADARERDWIAGFTYDMPAYNLRLQMNYLRKGLPPAIASARGLLLTNLQATW